MQTLIVIALAAVFLSSVLLRQTYQSLPLKELRRRARAGKDRRAGHIYKMAAYGTSLEVILWLVGVFSLTVLILQAADIAWWLAGLVIAFAWFIWSSNMFSGRGWTWSIAALLAPIVTGFLSLMHPIIDWFAKRFKKPTTGSHTGVYEKEDLLEMLDRQATQLDNRLSDIELKIAHNALTFGDKPVGRVMTPKRKIKFVEAGEAVGPLLMDELHEAGHKYFPVVKEVSKASQPEIVGTLYFKDLVDFAAKGKVRDVMKKGVYFINETQNLAQALSALLKTHHHLLIVVNNFEEVVGMLSLENVAEQILDSSITDEFDRYDDLRSVASLDTEKLKET